MVGVFGVFQFFLREDDEVVVQHTNAGYAG